MIYSFYDDLALARSLPIEARLLEAHDYGKVCSDCTSEFSSKLNIPKSHIIED